MGNGNSIMKINFESMKKIISSNYDLYLIINTLSIEKQDCLIKSTLTINQEIEYINKYIKTNKDIKIVIYGENCSDNNVINKYNQLYKLGFKNIYVYIGGLFEWLLLQDIYGDEEFPTTSKILDILKYKGTQII
tara:strand:+ start:295 stop:696 length:402 start_codon:yes stop_codon:yes gene_type:complete